MNYEQFKGAGDRVIAVAVGAILAWAAAKGWLGQEDTAILAPALVALVSAGIGVYVNRRTSIAMSATNLGDVVITTPEIAQGTPGYPKIISNASKPAVIAAAVADAKADVKEVNRKD